VSSGKVCSGADLRCWFCNPSQADSGYAKRVSLGQRSDWNSDPKRHYFTSFDLVKGCNNHSLEGNEVYFLSSTSRMLHCKWVPLIVREERIRWMLCTNVIVVPGDKSDPKRRSCHRTGVSKERSTSFFQTCHPACWPGLFIRYYRLLCVIITH